MIRGCSRRPMTTSSGSVPSGTTMGAGVSPVRLTATDDPVSDEQAPRARSETARTPRRNVFLDRESAVIASPRPQSVRDGLLRCVDHPGRPPIHEYAPAPPQAPVGLVLHFRTAAKPALRSRR